MKDLPFPTPENSGNKQGPDYIQRLARQNHQASPSAHVSTRLSFAICLVVFFVWSAGLTTESGPGSTRASFGSSIHIRLLVPVVTEPSVGMLLDVLLLLPHTLLTKELGLAKQLAPL